MPHLLRDRVTWLIYAQLGAWGYFLYGFGPVVPLLRDENHVSSAVAGLHSTAMAAGSMIGGAVAPFLLRRFGRGHAIWGSLAGVVACVVAFAALRGLEFTLPLAGIITIFGIVLITGVVAALNERHGAAAPAAITEANAVATGAGLVAPFVIGLTVSAGAGWRPGMLTLVAVIGAIALVAFFSRVRLPAGEVVAARGAGGRRPLGRAYQLAWVMMAVTGSVEAGLSLWAADLLRDRDGMSVGGAAQAISAIVAGMFLGRFVGARLSLRIAPLRLYFVALLTSAAGFAVFWTTTSPAVAVAGLLLLGLGNAMHYPIAIALALKVVPDQPDRAAAVASYSMGISFGAGPLVLGATADLVGVRLAFLIVPVLLVVAGALAWRLGRAMTQPVPSAALEPQPA
ncbi:MAG: MFS transporter [Hamadaea sp.]|uniref:MFS transporter n=1 Tax=Hamadaea sp. TaxID=2024425 RepID=UPI0018087086|nr:MFS transporter [Hamadaea sp.]NUR72275.1 MFS transporter [Hamadaea sp.]NUT23231.1 MFS transporter [Hamadaea sp.]